MKEMPLFLTASQIGEIMQISYQNALAFIKYSGIDYIRIGHQYRVEREKFSAFFLKKGNIDIPLDS